MNTFIVERNVPQGRAGDSAETIAGQAEQLTKPDGSIRWLQTVITDAKIYSLFSAPSAEQLRRTATHQGYTIHRLLQVTNKQVGTDFTERSMYDEN